MRPRNASPIPALWSVFHRIQCHAFQTTNTPLRKRVTSTTAQTFERRLSRKHLDQTVASSADDPLPVLAPNAGTNAFAAHDAVARDLLRAGAFFQAPEAQGSIVAGAHQLLAVGTERESRDRVWVRQHIIGTLACATSSVGCSRQIGIWITYRCWHQRTSRRSPRVQR